MQSYLSFMSALFGLLLLLPPAWSADVRRTTAVRTSEKIRIDGVLDEEVWRNTEPIGKFVQADPFPGKDPTEPTEVRIAYGEESLYIAVRCFERDPKTIFTSTLTRDNRAFRTTTLRTRAGYVS